MVTGIGPGIVCTGTLAIARRISSARWRRKSHIAVIQHHEELFPTIAANEIVRAHRREKPAGNLPQYLVSSNMSKSVVNILEVIHVSQ